MQSRRRLHYLGVPFSLHFQRAPGKLFSHNGTVKYIHFILSSVKLSGNAMIRLNAFQLTVYILQEVYFPIWEINLLRQKICVKWHRLDFFLSNFQYLLALYIWDHISKGIA